MILDQQNDVTRQDVINIYVSFVVDMIKIYVSFVVDDN